MESGNDSIQRKYKVLSELFNEHEQGLWAAVEASELGRGGISVVSRATGLSRNTISRGAQEVARMRSGEAVPRGRIRAKGGGRNALTETDPERLAQLERLVEPTARGDPQSP